MFRILSWGAGVQSTALAVMSALGDVEPLDAVIFADTGWEQKATYETVEFYSQWFADHDIRLEIVRGGDIRKHGVEEHIHIPFWTSGGGPLRRQCTRHFKINPVRRKARQLIGYHPTKPPHPKPGQIEQWLGISYDELERMKPSRVKFTINRHPLVDKRITRNDCIDYLNGLGLPVPVKSSCVICPYRQASGWRDMRDNSPSEFEEAVLFDEANRDNPLASTGSTADQIYLYKKAISLREADLDRDAKRERPGKQLALFCDGHCGT